MAHPLLEGCRSSASTAWRLSASGGAWPGRGASSPSRPSRRAAGSGCCTRSCLDPGQCRCHPLGSHRCHCPGGWCPPCHPCRAVDGVRFPALQIRLRDRGKALGVPLHPGVLTAASSGLTPERQECGVGRRVSVIVEEVAEGNPGGRQPGAELLGRPRLRGYLGVVAAQGGRGHQQIAQRRLTL